VHKDSVLIHPVLLTALSVSDLTPADPFLHCEENIVYADSGYHGTTTRPQMAGQATEYMVTMRPGNARL
jgi:hypothetical protein